MNLNIDRNSNITIYNQIANQIIEAVKKGYLKPGERLPTQREISAGFNISRGTVQKAYEELENMGIVEILKGSGSFVSRKKGENKLDRKETAINLIDELITKLSDLNFTSREIRAFLDIRILEKENKHNSVIIAAIDCNPEALEIFRMQFSFMKNIQFRMFILDDVLKYSQPDKVFEDYDIIITTINHYDQLNGILYSIREKLFKVAVSPASDTIIKIATIPKNSSIGIVTKSMKFRDIILRNFKSFDIDNADVEHALTSDINDIKKILLEKEFLIIPQSYRLKNKAFKEEFKRFIKKGGEIIEFKYQIDRGSLLYIDERIENILQSK